MSNRDKLYSLIKKHGTGNIPAKLIHDIGNSASVTRVLRKLRTNGIIDYRYINKKECYRITEINELQHKSIRNKLSGKIRYKVLERDSFKCRACGRGTDKVELEVDHIIPIQWGGQNDLDNLQALCKDCNNGKKDLYDKFLNNKTVIEVRKQPSGAKRIEKLFLLNPNVEIPKYIIEKMAGIDDWTRTIRKLRTKKEINIQPITKSNKNNGYIYKPN